jgi:hypothetical protein
MRACPVAVRPKFPVWILTRPTGKPRLQPVTPFSTLQLVESDSLVGKIEETLSPSSRHCQRAAVEPLPERTMSSVSAPYCSAVVLRG